MLLVLERRLSFELQPARRRLSVACKLMERKRVRRVSFAPEEDDEDERRGRDAAQRRCAIASLSRFS
jgi:hypothetical protein